MTKPFLPTASGYALLACTALLMQQTGWSGPQAQAKMSKGKVTEEQVKKEVAQPEDPGCKDCLKNATKLFATGKPEEAVASIRAWQDRCPNNLQMQLLLNVMLMNDPKTRDQALKAAQRACQIAPDSMHAHLQTAMTHMIMGDSAQARSEFERVVAIDPANYEGWNSLAEIYAGQHESEKAIEAKIKAQSLDPTARAARIKLVKNMDRAGQDRSAREELAKLAADQSIPAEAFMAIGVDAMAMGYFSEAADCFKRFITAHSTGPAAVKPLSLLTLAHYFARDGKCDESLSKLKTQGTETNPSYMALTGLFALDRGDFEDGKKSIEQAGTAPQKDAVIAYALGRLALKEGQYKTAIEKLEDAAKISPALSASKLWVALANYKEGDYIESMSICRDCTKIKDLSGRAQALELRAKLKDGNAAKQTLAELLQAVEATQRLKTEDSEANLALGYYDFFAKDLNSAKERFNKALENNPACEDAMIGLARIAKKEGASEAGTELLQKALKTAPGDKEALELENGKDNTLK